MNKKVLVVDDEPMILNAIQMILEDLGNTVKTFDSPEEALTVIAEQDFDLVVSDIRMPSMNGAELTEKILRIKPQQKILIITAYPNDEYAVKALKLGAKGLLKKPFEIAKILDFLKEPS